jgi:hypothetical protein
LRWRKQRLSSSIEVGLAALSLFVFAGFAAPRGVIAAQRAGASDAASPWSGTIVVTEHNDNDSSQPGDECSTDASVTLDLTGNVSGPALFAAEGTGGDVPGGEVYQPAVVEPTSSFRQDCVSHQDYINSGPCTETDDAVASNLHLDPNNPTLRLAVTYDPAQVQAAIPIIFGTSTDTSSGCPTTAGTTTYNNQPILTTDCEGPNEMVPVANDAHPSLTCANPAGTTTTTWNLTLSPTVDSDGDGCPDVEELADGTNPVDPASHGSCDKTRKQCKAKAKAVVTFAIYRAVHGITSDRCWTAVSPTAPGAFSARRKWTACGDTSKTAVRPEAPGYWYFDDIADVLTRHIEQIRACAERAAHEAHTSAASRTNGYVFTAYRPDRGRSLVPTSHELAAVRKAVGPHVTFFYEMYDYQLRGGGCPPFQPSCGRHPVYSPTLAMAWRKGPSGLIPMVDVTPESTSTTEEVSAGIADACAAAKARGVERLALNIGTGGGGSALPPAYVSAINAALDSCYE